MALYVHCIVWDMISNIDKMENRKYYTVRTVPKSNRKSVKRGMLVNPNRSYTMQKTNFHKNINTTCNS